MVGELSIADHNCQTHIRFRNFIDYESFINAIDQKYESEDATFNRYIFTTVTPHCKLVNRSQNGNGFDFNYEIIEYRGNNCFIPKGYCFVKCINFITGEDYKQQYPDFIGIEKKKRSNIMTKAKIQPFLGQIILL